MTPHTSPPHRRAPAYVGVLALLASVVVALTLPGTAMATACGDKVLADWFDNGRIDRLYDLHCYEEAIDAIPADLRDYANAEEIISRALQFAVGGDIDPVGGPDPTPGGNGSAEGPGVLPGPDDPENPSGDPNAAPEVDTTGISSVPIPLIVLGGMSIALLGAGGLGYVSRRRAAAHADDGSRGPDDDLLS